MELDAWRSQLRKGAAELAVLAVLREGESYGIQLLETIRDQAGLELSEGSIYPLLKRLETEGKIASRWVDDADATHLRKYYSLTDEGIRILGLMRTEWHRFEKSMRAIVGEGASYA